MEIGKRADGQKENVKISSDTRSFPDLSCCVNDRVFITDADQIRTILTVQGEQNNLPLTWSTESINPETDFFAIEDSSVLYFQGVMTSGR